jgi:hypothetical protein
VDGAPEPPFTMRHERISRKRRAIVLNDDAFSTVPVFILLPANPCAVTSTVAKRKIFGKYSKKQLTSKTDHL